MVAVTMTALAAIVSIITGVLASKPFLIFIGLGLFLLGFLSISAVTNIPWIIIFVVVLVIISKTLKK